MDHGALPSFVMRFRNLEYPLTQSREAALWLTHVHHFQVLDQTAGVCAAHEHDPVPSAVVAATFGPLATPGLAPPMATQGTDFLHV